MLPVTFTNSHVTAVIVKSPLRPKLKLNKTPLSRPALKFVAQMIHCLITNKQTNKHSVWLVCALADDDWQEEHKRLAELDERDGLGAGLGAGGMGGESELGGAEDSSSIHLPLPPSLPSLKFSSSSSGLPPPGQ